MENKSIYSNNNIIECLNTTYHINVTKLTPLSLGADIDASVYKAQTNDNASYFVKLQYGSHNDVGTIIQSLLHDAGIQQIIPLIKTKNNLPIHHIDNCTLTVYPFIEGQNGFERNLTDDQWIILGKTLRKIHDFKLSSSIEKQIKHESYSPQWRKAVRSIYTKIDTNLKPSDEIASKLLAFMKAHRKTILQLVDRAEQLAQKIKNESYPFVLCHSDIHGGNVLLTNDRNLYIVDWDQPIMAPKERDLMFIGGGVANVWNNPHEEQLFYKGYGEAKINKEALAYYRQERIIEDVAIYAQQLLLTADGGEERSIMYKHFTNMFKPNGVVDIAFKTDNF